MKKIYSNLNKSIFWTCLFVAIGLIIAGFIIEPPGQIHQSVITAIGELFLFPVLATINHAIDKGTDIKIKHNNTEVELDGDGDGD